MPPARTPLPGTVPWSCPGEELALRPRLTLRQVKDVVNAGDLRLEAGRIEFENVHFSYMDGYGAAGMGWQGGTGRAMGPGTGSWGSRGGPEPLSISLSQEGNPAGRLLLCDARADSGPGESGTLGVSSLLEGGMGEEGLGRTGVGRTDPQPLPCSASSSRESLMSPSPFTFTCRWDLRARGRAPSSACSSASTTCGVAASASTGRTSPR